MASTLYATLSLQQQASWTTRLNIRESKALSADEYHQLCQHPVFYRLRDKAVTIAPFETDDLIVYDPVSQEFVRHILTTPACIDVCHPLVPPKRATCSTETQTGSGAPIHTDPVHRTCQRLFQLVNPLPSKAPRPTVREDMQHVDRWLDQYEELFGPTHNILECMQSFVWYANQCLALVTGREHTGQSLQHSLQELQRQLMQINDSMRLLEETFQALPPSNGSMMDRLRVITGSAQDLRREQNTSTDAARVICCKMFPNSSNASKPPTIQDVKHQVKKLHTLLKDYPRPDGDRAEPMAVQFQQVLRRLSHRPTVTVATTQTDSSETGTMATQTEQDEEEVDAPPPTAPPSKRSSKKPRRKPVVESAASPCIPHESASFIDTSMDVLKKMQHDTYNYIHANNCHITTRGAILHKEPAEARTMENAERVILDPKVTAILLNTEAAMVQTFLRKSTSSLLAVTDPDETFAGIGTLTFVYNPLVKPYRIGMYGSRDAFRGSLTEGDAGVVGAMENLWMVYANTYRGVLFSVISILNAFPSNHKLNYEQAMVSAEFCDLLPDCLATMRYFCHEFSRKHLDLVCYEQLLILQDGLSTKSPAAGLSAVDPSNRLHFGKWMHEWIVIVEAIFLHLFTHVYDCKLMQERLRRGRTLDVGETKVNTAVSSEAVTLAREIELVHVDSLLLGNVAQHAYLMLQNLLMVFYLHFHAQHYHQQDLYYATGIAAYVESRALYHCFGPDSDLAELIPIISNKLKGYYDLATKVCARSMCNS